MSELTARHILDRLVSFPTVSTESNLDLVDWLETYLMGHGIECHRHWNEDRTKAALMAHAGPRVAGGVVLSGHSDVVPVAGQAWATDPWTVAEAERLDAALKARHPGAGVHLTRFFGVPGLHSEPGGAAEALARHLTGGNSVGVVSYGTKAGQFQDAGCSAVICGPGDIAHAHQADEYLEVSEFEAGHRFMERLLESLT